MIYKLLAITVVLLIYELVFVVLNLSASFTFKLFIATGTYIVISYNAIGTYIVISYNALVYSIH
jgi:hypothetical protein